MNGSVYMIVCKSHRDRSQISGFQVLGLWGRRLTTKARDEELLEDDNNGLYLTCGGGYMILYICQD